MATLRISSDLENVIKKVVLDTYFPVGSLYLTVGNENPNTTIGGTWVRFGNGKTLVGVDTNDSDFNSVEKTGGEKTHRLTINEMPSHKHEVKMSYTPNSNHTHSNGTYAMSFAEGANPSDNTYQSTDDRISNTGNNQAHNNLQPYITVYMWKRTK